MASGATGTSPEKLIVGITYMPPYAMKGTGGRWEGLSVDLWREVAQEMGVPYEWREFATVAELIDNTRSGAIDVLPALAVIEVHEKVMEFSRQYLRSGLAIAVAAKSRGTGLFHLARRLLSSDLLMVMGILLLLSLMAGFVVWRFEGRRNRDFEGGIREGIGNGFWWAVVTLTTVGYGDKAPQTLGGRLTAVIWMFSSIFLIASFTAAITTTLTISEISGNIRGFEDLPGARVGSIARTVGMEYMAQENISARSFNGVREGLQALAEDRIEAFVSDEAVLKHMVRVISPGTLMVLPDSADHYYVGMAMPAGSPLREPINRALLKVIARDEWDDLIDHYLGNTP
jgi:ABC-type amino acid transport substrate-binding protein